MNDAALDRILLMFTEDQNARRDKMEGHPDLIELSKVHTSLLKSLLEESRGWGFNGMNELYPFSIVIHADHDVEFQEYCLGLMKEKSINKDLVAYLTDRVKVNRGEGQIYGTQLYYQDGRYHAYDIADAKTVDIRRMGVGLPPLSEYIASMYE